MNYKTILFLILILNQTMIFSQTNRTVNQEIKNKKLGISIGMNSFSIFYGDKYGNTYTDWSKGVFVPTIDIVYYSQLKNRISFTPKLGYVFKTNTSNGGVPYSFNYITLSALLGYNIMKKLNSKKYISLGPYVGYVFGVKKGRYNLVDHELKKNEFGIELLFSDIDLNRKNYNPFAFNTAKVQLGLTDIYFFKTFIVTISLIGFSL